LPEAARAAWEWARWLPHAWEDEARSRRAIGCTPQQARRVLGDLAEVLEQRRKRSGDSAAGARAAPLPAIVAVFADRSLWAQPPSGLAPILRRVRAEGPGLGIYSLFLDARPERLPQECRAVLDATGPTTLLRTRRPPASDAVVAITPDG